MKLSSFFTALCAFLLITTEALFGAPVITSLSPFVGPSSGGTLVSIQGSGFTGTTAVDFGGRPAASFLVLSDILIQAISPEHSPEVVFVTVIAGSPSPHTREAYFVYQGSWQAYVGNTSSDNVSAINIDTNIATHIPVGASPVSLAITPDGTKTYITNLLSSNVSVIDTATNTVIATIAVGDQPFGIAITPNGTKAYVANRSSDNVSVIDTATDTVITTIVVGDGPQGVVVTPDGTKAYVTNTISNNVSVIDTATNTVIATIGVGLTPGAIVIIPNQNKAYVANAFGDSISVIDIASDTVLTTIGVGVRPFAIAITPDETKAYVVNLADGTVSVIDIATDTVITTIGVGSIPTSIAITPNGTKAYVTNQSSASVSVIDIATDMVVKTITVGSLPTSVALIPDGTRAYVTNAGESSVSVIDTAIDEVITTVTVGLFPQAIVITPDQAPLAKFRVSIAPAGFPSTFDASDSTSPVGEIANYFWDFGDGHTLSTSSPLASHIYSAPGNYTVTLTVTNSSGTSTRQVFLPSTTNNGATAISYFLNGGPSAETTQQITIPILPLITGINPHTSSTCGEIVVTITGENFVGITAVFFGSQPALSFTVHSDQLITAIAPPGAPGTVDVRVINAIGSSLITAANQFTYLPPLPPKDLRGCQNKNRFATQTDIINILKWKAPTDTCKPVAYRIYRDKCLTHFVAEVCAKDKLEFIEHNRKKGKTYTYFVVSVDRFGNVSAPAKVVIHN